LFLSCGLAHLSRPNAGAEDFVAISSKVSNGYVRTKLPDGSIEPETYAFKEGGFLSNRMADDTIDKMTFASVTHAITGPLASRDYFPSVDPKAARLLIVVYWGTSRAPAETSGSTPIGQRMQQDILSNAAPGTMRGYDPFKDNWAALQARAQAFADKMVIEEDAMMLGYGSATDPELKEYRYFVVLLAYDLQALLRDSKERLLWQTRFSMNEHRNQFDRQLGAMVARASAYFGRDSFGLKRDPVPEGYVEIGEVRSIGAVPDPNTSAALSPDGVHVAYLTRDKNGLELAIADIDNQEHFSSAEVPGSNGKPVQLAWFDAGRVVVRLSSSELLVFSDRGKRVDFDPRTIGPSFDGFSRAVADDAAVIQVRALVEEKLPDRNVVILGTDKARRRYLLIASDRAAAGRFFVYDRPDDLLYELGRSIATQ